MILVYALIAIVVFLALAPLWHFRPTKNQRRQAGLRETAAVNGLFVEFRDRPLPAERFERLPAVERQLLYYGCRLPSLRGEPPATVNWYRQEGEWMSMPRRVAVPEFAAQLPESVLALGVSPSSCGVFWKEQGDEEFVVELAQLLQSWRDSISAARP